MLTYVCLVFVCVFIVFIGLTHLGLVVFHVFLYAPVELQLDHLPPRHRLGVLEPPGGELWHRLDPFSAV